MVDPCDLSIGLPDYDAPDAVKRAAIEAITAGRNRYTPTAGLPELRARIGADLKREFGFESAVLVTSGVSGGLFLALMVLVEQGDEVLFADPYFVSYFQLVRMIGGEPVTVPCYPDFRFDAAAFEAKITRKTKVLILNSPGNPTGRVMCEAEVRAAADLARRHNLMIISDEIYEGLCYDGPNVSPMRFAPANCLMLRGYGKTYGVTGWRMGYAAGPAEIIAEMTKFQQFTFVCAPSMAQYATLAAVDTDVSEYRRTYAAKRDLTCELLSGVFEFQRPSGGFYVFPRVPRQFESGSAFALAAVDRGVLVIPGNVFSGRDTHFRVSYAASEDRLRGGCELLCKLART
jgi:aspartate aminotransferase/aminotransferase